MEAEDQEDHSERREAAQLHDAGEECGERGGPISVYMVSGRGPPAGGASAQGPRPESLSVTGNINCFFSPPSPPTPGRGAVITSGA